MTKAKQRPNRRQVDPERASRIMQAAKKLAEQGTAELREKLGSSERENINEDRFPK